MNAPPILAAEAVRQTYLKHEASIQSVGILYYLGAVMSPLAGIAGLVSTEQPGLERTAICAVLLVLGVIYFKVGRWLRVLDPKAKTPTTLLSVLGLFAFPIGTLINAYILSLIHSEKGKMVFSPEYRSVIEATPEIQYKTSVIVWIALGLLALLIVVGLAGLVVAGRETAGATVR